MNQTSVKNYADALSTHTLHRSWSVQVLRSQVIKQLKTLKFGKLWLIEADEKHTFDGFSMTELVAEIEVLDEQFYSYVALGGSVGAGEAYINGFWRSNNLTNVIRLFATNQSVMDSMESGLARFTLPLKSSFIGSIKILKKAAKKISLRTMI